MDEGIPLTFRPFGIAAVGQPSNIALRCHIFPCVCRRTLRYPREIRGQYLSTHTSEDKLLQLQRVYEGPKLCACEATGHRELTGVVAVPVVDIILDIRMGSFEVSPLTEYKKSTTN